MPTPCDAYVPAWARQAVFYQIYPLGFFGAPATNSARLECVPRLARLREQYDHLRGLGASAIYFCPVFESLSHGYDTTDYLRVDRRLHVALLFLLTAAGIPCLHYGDEIGLRGQVERGSDRAVRQPMPAPGQPWPEHGEAILNTTRRLVALRREHPCLWRGDLTVLEVGPQADTLAYLRRAEGETGIIILNSAGEARSLDLQAGLHGVPDGAVFEDVLDPERPSYRVEGGRLVLPVLYPCWGRVLVRQEA